MSESVWEVLHDKRGKFSVQLHHPPLLWVSYMLGNGTYKELVGYFRWTRAGLRALSWILRIEMFVALGE